MELNSFGCFPLCVNVADTRKLLVTRWVVTYPSDSRKSIEDKNSLGEISSGNPLRTQKVLSGQFNK